jgi:genome maintenance exonuclease 1
LGSSNFFFEHDPVAIDELEVIEENGRRLYVTPSGQRYPSITSVLSILGKDGIMAWRKRVGEEEANRISARAAGRGTRIHKMCEDYLNNVLQETIEKYTDWDRIMFESMRSVFDEYISKVRVQEASLYSDFMRVAGRVDCIAEFDGKLSVIDFKTSSKLKEERYIQNYFMQTAGYAVMFEERTGIPINRLVIIIGVDDEINAQVFVKKRDDYVEEFMDVRSDYKKLYGI